MNTQAIAHHLNLAQDLIVEVQEWARVLWVRIRGMRPRFVSKKVTKEMIQVEVSKEKVVVDRKNNVAYVIRRGFNVGWFHLIKKFDPTGIDIRFMDFSTTKGEILPDQPSDKQHTAEYSAVMGAIAWSKPKLVAWGMPGTCKYPCGYEEKAATFC